MNNSLSVAKETTIVVKDFLLEGVTTLHAKKIITTYEVTREVDSRVKDPNPKGHIVSKKKLEEKSEFISFNLVEVTPKKLAEYRIETEDAGGFILKVDDKLYFTKISKEISLFSYNLIGSHQCAISGHECSRLSTASDLNGGCAKVRGYSKHIERYPFIKLGYETFGTFHDCFVVVECLNYKQCPPRKKLTPIEFKEAKLGLAHFFYN